MKVLITGADGFIGRNLRLHLAQRGTMQLETFVRGDSPADLRAKVRDADFVFHLAGANRPKDPAEFEVGNHGVTAELCSAVGESVAATGRRPVLVLASSTQAAVENPYGVSKRRAEETLRSAVRELGLTAHIFRLPNVFGKWCKPNYNSVVATFCHNIARDLPIQVNAAATPLRLVYVDDVVGQFLAIIDGESPAQDASGFALVSPEYTATVPQLAEQIRAFRDSRETLITEPVGAGLVRALHASYLSYLPKEAFSYALERHTDPRGVFVEMLKTRDSGQFSFFTAHPGVTRGGHYHHTKTEKFLVIQGTARFRFRHMDTGETHQIETRGVQPEVVETVPGWTHDVTNVGEDELIVVLWANEIFDRARPDTYSSLV